MSEDLFGTIMVPIADPEDARQTARSIQAYLGTDSEVIVTHVVPKGEGVPDKASVEQREEFAEESYEAFIDELGAGAEQLTPLTLYGRDIAETIVDGARDAGATAIVFTPRGASRWMKLLTGSVTEDLVSNTDIPVLVLPQDESIVTD